MACRNSWTLKNGIEVRWLDELQPGANLKTEGNLGAGLYFGSQPARTSLKANGSRVLHQITMGETTFIPPGWAGESEYHDGRPEGRMLFMPPSLLVSSAHKNSHDIWRLASRRDDVMLNLMMAVIQLGPSPDPLLADHLGMAIARNVAGWFGCQLPDNDRAGQRFARVIEYIHDNIASPISTEELSSIARMSQFHFVRQFRKAYGEPPYQFVMSKRIELAKAMLQRSSATLSDVALSCGFSDQSHFTRAFKAKTGMTPGRYARRS